MSLTTALRFLRPVDPRHVWETAQQAVDAPPGYTWRVYPAHTTPLSDPNVVWMADSGQGAAAWAIMRAGPDGAPLQDDWEELPPDEQPPSAYVEVEFTNGDRNRHPDILAAMIAWTPVPVAIRDDYTGKWTAVRWGGCPVT